MDANNETTFYIGDSDLWLLGLAAGMAARYESRRKSGVMRGIEGFPQSDIDALEIVQAGLDAAAEIPADDVPRLQMGIFTDKGVLRRLLDMAGWETDPDIEDDDDDHGDDWKGEPPGDT